MTVKHSTRNRILLTGGLVAVLAVVAGALLSGLPITPSRAALASLKEVPSYDVLEWQAEREAEILADYGAGSFSMETPYVLLDPYGMNPCSALVVFDTAEPGAVSVTVEGDSASSTYRYSVASTGTRQEVPILYLYAGRENHVVLEDGRGTTVELSVTTEPLPDDFQTLELEASVPDLMEPGLTLFTACFEDSYTALVDPDGKVRGYLSNVRMAHGTTMLLLRNGHMMSTGDEYRQIPYNMTSLWEFDWLGKVYHEFEVPNAIHHSLYEMPNGNILAASNARDLFTAGTREDVAVVVDRTTGAVVKEYDFRGILDETRAPFNHFDPGVLHALNIDWMHMNSVLYDAEHDAVVVSSPIQSQVVSIDAATGEIQWILGPHDGYDGSSASLAKYLLTPVGTDLEWSWGQHGVEILPDADHDPETIDLLMLDNGQNRSFTEAGAVLAENNYSRGVVYRIRLSDRTIEQIREYGKERGSDGYATFLGDADYLPATGNILIDFGGQLRVEGKPVDRIIGGVLGTIETDSRIVEVASSGQVVFEVASRGNPYSSSAETYQVLRLPVPSLLTVDAPLGAVRGERAGESYLIHASTATKVPPIFFGRIGVSFRRLVNENGRLVVDGSLTYDDRTYLLGKALVIFRSRTRAYVFPANSGLNGRFFASIDTKEMPADTYRISIAGAVRMGTDAASGKTYQGHVLTEYKLTVE